MNNNPYFNPMQTYIPRYPNMEMQQQPMNQQSYVPPVQNNQPVLLGKSVDSIDVVKATDIPLDGSTSYFPLADGSAIVTKKLQADGTSKTTVYRPIEEEQKELPTYVTPEELREAIEEIDPSKSIKKLEEKFDDLKDEFKELKKSKKKDD